MPADAPSPSDRISSAIQKLIPAASKLTSANEGLSKAVAEVETALKRLNLGVASWTNLTKHEDEFGDYERWDLGYGRHQGLWAILIKCCKGSNSAPDRDDEDIWFFSDAPRFIKAKAIDRLPDLIEGLVAVSDSTAEKLVRKTAVAQELAKVVTSQMPSNKK